MKKFLQPVLWVLLFATLLTPAKFTGVYSILKNGFGIALFAWMLFALVFTVVDRRRAKKPASE